MAINSLIEKHEELISLITKIGYINNNEYEKDELITLLFSPNTFRTNIINFCFSILENNKYSNY